MIGNRCHSCLWWDCVHESIGEYRKQGFGYCRKHKPVIYGKENRHWGGWPLVDKNDFCGEFREDIGD